MAAPSMRMATGKTIIFFMVLSVIGCNDSGRSAKSSKWKNYLDIIDNAVAEYDGFKTAESSCDGYLDVLENDLSTWKNGITKDQFNTGKDKGSHYIIKDQKLYREDACLFPFRCSGIEHFILDLLPELPDMEFIFNSHDWPKVISGWPIDKRAPVFSFSKPTGAYSDIMCPAWTFWEGGPAVWPIYPNGLGRWDIQIKEISKKAKEWPWPKKYNKGYFIGSRTSSERDPLIYLSRAEPDLVDAQYVKNQAWKSEKDTLGQPPAKEVLLKDHCPYKYLFNFRGVAASFRFKHLFLCDSLVFHVGDTWQEFFYKSLKPWVHYIPVPSSMENVKELLKFAQENDDVVKEIAERGRQFILDHLTLDEVSCYWRHLLLRYADLMKWKVEEVPANFKLISKKRVPKDEF